MIRQLKRGMALAALLALTSAPVWSGSHTWIVNEIYSNPDGTIQFVELWTPGPNENNIANKAVTSNVNTSPVFPANLPAGATADTYLLLGTSHFANLPGAPALDMPAMQDNFFSINGDVLQWHIYVPSILSFGPGDLPTDGVQSLAHSQSITCLSPDGQCCGTPTNFAGDVFEPRDTSGLRIAKLPPSQSRIRLTWGSCLGNSDHHIVWGTAADLGTGSYALSGSQCNIGCSPYNWVFGVPAPASGDWVWILLLGNDDDSTEGSWGQDSAGNERNNAAGHSGLCSITAKNVANTCQ